MIGASLAAAVKRKTSTTRRPPPRAPCKCRFLERSAAEPGIPIVFDASVNEFHIRHGGKDRGGHSIIYYCPFCGGAAPPSKRASLFATITQAEVKRLQDVTTGFKSVREVMTRFGKPDHDFDPGMTKYELEAKDKPPKVISYRTLTYRGLSKIADVVFTDLGPERGVPASFMGKYLLAKKGRASRSPIRGGGARLQRRAQSQDHSDPTSRGTLRAP
jgi:hypothetical protein